MKILFLTRLYSPHVGGVEKQVSELSKRLKNKGHKVKILTEKYERSLASKEVIDGIEVVRIGHPNIKYFGLISIWVWLLKNYKHIKNSDIVHTHGVFIWYWPFKLIFPKKPIYTTFHGWEGVYPIPKKNILLRRLAARLAWKNITICDYVEKHYGIKADELMYTSVDLPKKTLRSKDPKRLVYVGRLDEDTGLPKIFKALTYLNGYKIDFCGDGPMKRECENYGIVHGFVNPNPYFDRSFICLSPGHTSILEAFTYKCLVITTYNNPLKKDYLLMTPFKDWIVVENSPVRMAEKIKYYSKHPIYAKSKIDNSYQWVSGQNWDNATKTYLELWGVK